MPDTPASRNSADSSHSDEDMKLSDTIIDYRVSLLLNLYNDFSYNDFWYNSLGSTCTCLYLLVGTNVPQSANSSKLNFWFIDSPTVLHWKVHNSTIRSAIEVNELLLESLFDSLSNGLGPNSISHRQGLQIIKSFCRYFWQVQWRRRGLVIHTWDPGPSWSTPQEDGEHLRDAQGRPPPWPPP